MTLTMDQMERIRDASSKRMVAVRSIDLRMRCSTLAHVCTDCESYSRAVSHEQIACAMRQRKNTQRSEIEYGRRFVGLESVFGDACMGRSDS